MGISGTIGGRKPGESVFRALMAAVVFLAIGFGFGAGLERSGVLPGANACETLSADHGFETFVEAWNLVQDNYVDRSAVDSTRMAYAAVEAMLDTLGDVGHTRFLSPDALREEEDLLAGKLEGIGPRLRSEMGKQSRPSPDRRPSKPVCDRETSYSASMARTPPD
jgi:carboxyl-terminal processing protease